MQMITLTVNLEFQPAAAVLLRTPLVASSVSSFYGDLERPFIYMYVPNLAQRSSTSLPLDLCGRCPALPQFAPQSLITWCHAPGHRTPAVTVHPLLTIPFACPCATDIYIHIYYILHEPPVAPYTRATTLIYT